MPDDRSPERLKKVRREPPDAKNVAGDPLTGASGEPLLDSVESSGFADNGLHPAVTDPGQSSGSGSRVEIKLEPAAQPPAGISRRLALMRFRRRPPPR
jgi:hypothetical protein